MTIREHFGYWYPIFKSYLKSKEGKNLIQFLRLEYKRQKIIPIKENLFKIFRMIRPENVKVLIIGLDPYPSIRNGTQVANGIAFGTDIEGYIPKSLNNLYNEIKRDYNLPLHTNYYFADHSLNNSNASILLAPNSCLRAIQTCNQLKRSTLSMYQIASLTSSKSVTGSEDLSKRSDLTLTFSFLNRYSGSTLSASLIK